DGAFFAEVQPSYVRWAPATPADGTPLRAAADIPSSSDELDRSGRFGPATFRRHEWELSYTTPRHAALLLTSSRPPSQLAPPLTYSGPRALGPPTQAGLLDCIATLIDTGYGGRITKRYL